MTDAPRVRQSLETKRDKIWGPHRLDQIQFVIVCAKSLSLCSRRSVLDGE